MTLICSILHVAFKTNILPLCLKIPLFTKFFHLKNKISSLLFLTKLEILCSSFRFINNYRLKFIFLIVKIKRKLIRYSPVTFLIPSVILSISGIKTKEIFLVECLKYLLRGNLIKKQRYF